MTLEAVARIITMPFGMVCIVREYDKEDECECVAINIEINGAIYKVSFGFESAEDADEYAKQYDAEQAQILYNNLTNPS